MKITKLEIIVILICSSILLLFSLIKPKHDLPVYNKPIMNTIVKEVV